MVRKLRKAPPEIVRLLLESDLTKSGFMDMSVDQIVAILKAGKLAKNTKNAKELLVHAYDDGMLKRVTTGRNGDVQRNAIRFPELAELKLQQHDVYCYECHTAGRVVKCSTCWRSFHRRCYRTDAETPNWGPSKAGRPQNDIDSYLRRTVPAQTVSPQPRASLDDEVSHAADDKHPTDYKVDVECLGETRPPMRQRPNTTASNISWKSETFVEDEVPEDQNMCTCCRLSNKARLGNPPNMLADELCYLLQFIFNTTYTWILLDARSALAKMPIGSAELKQVADKFLFSGDGSTFYKISQKLARQEYSLMNEFVVDMLNVHHDVGVFYGTEHKLYGLSKCMVSDVNNLTAECRRCSDCFRHSYEKQSKYWFAKPCVQRHELVYAKVSGYDYWPAKILRHLGGESYEVRFFGGAHERATVTNRFIKSIDTDTKQFKLSKSNKLQLALEEVRWHQSLSAQSPSIFAFKAQPYIRDEIIELAIGGVITGPLNEVSDVNAVRDSLPSTSTQPTFQQPTSTARRGRGRPRRVERELAIEKVSFIPRANAFPINGIHLDQMPSTSKTTTPKRGRGRPRRVERDYAIEKVSFIPQANALPINGIHLDQMPLKSGRGRPRLVNRDEAIEKVSSIAPINGIHLDQMPSTSDTTREKTGQPNELLVRATVHVDAPSKSKESAKSVHRYPTRSSTGLPTKAEFKRIEKLLQTANDQLSKKDSIIRKLKATRRSQDVLDDKRIACIKRGQWCYVCLKQASFVCCFNASYCSNKCQSTDLNAGHDYLCNKRTPIIVA